MKISIYLNVLLLALAIKIVTANIGLPLAPQKYCGSNLANHLRDLCKGKYNFDKNLPTKKRNQLDSEFMDYINEDYYNNVLGYSYRPRQGAVSFIPSRFLRSSKRGIIDECCKRPCHVTELRQYCA